MMRGILLFLFAAAALSAGPAVAKGDLAIKATRLAPLILGSDESDFAMSVKEYRIETGKLYRWKIVSGGKREYNIRAQEFWRNTWIQQIAVGEMELKTPVLEELDFDGPGELEVFFVPIRTGTYEYRSHGLEERGMAGKIIVE
jgi:hypothetical protein